MDFNINLKDAFKTEEIAQSVIKLTGSISQNTMAIQNLKNIGNIWNNNDISTGEKMAQTFSSIVTVIPMVIMGINGIRTAIKTLEVSSAILFAISVAIMAIVTAVTYIIDAFQSEEKQMKENIKTANELSNAYTKYEAEGAIGLVMNPKTGEILAMSSYPSFNPANYKEYSTEVINRNLAIWANFEPGSTFKNVTLLFSNYFFIYKYYLLVIMIDK